MASLILHGNLDNSEAPLDRKLYCRPVMKAVPNSWMGAVEMIPEDTLIVDLIHRAIRRMFEGDQGEPASAPSVRIVNFSIGDRVRIFDRSLSPLARLLDFLSWKYNILFIVSAGNHPDEICLSCARQDFSGLNAQQIEREVVRAIDEGARHRRLLSPGESINSVTVGAMHEDSIQQFTLGARVNPYLAVDLPSPISAVGFGCRRAIKPEILLPGGRQLYTEKMGTTHTNATLAVSGSIGPPGLRAAAPSRNLGGLSATRYSCGTSNAAALATRSAARIYRILEELRANSQTELLDEVFTAVLLKTLLVHGASWDTSMATLYSLLEDRINEVSPRQYLSRYLGYGRLSTSRVLTSTDERVTILGAGELTDGEAHVFQMPLPVGLSGLRINKRLTVTLAWCTPTNASHSAYRRAALWIDPPLTELRLDRKQVDPWAVRRGTVQHEVLEGDSATVFEDGVSLELKVNCMADAGKLQERVKYGLAVTLEVAPETPVALYEEIRARLRPQITINPPV